MSNISEIKAIKALIGSGHEQFNKAIENKNYVQAAMSDSYISGLKTALSIIAPKPKEKPATSQELGLS